MRTEKPRRVTKSESGITGVGILVALALMAAGCGKKEPPRSSIETPEYQQWQGSLAIHRMVGDVPTEMLPGTVVVQFPQGRSKNEADFVELCVNGRVVQHSPVRTPSGAPPAPFSVNISLRPGADWLDLWDSTTNKNYRYQIDTRQGTDFVFTPTDGGYDLTWTKRE